MQPQSLVHSARFRAVARIRPTLAGEPPCGGLGGSLPTTPRQQHSLRVEGCTVRVGTSNPHDYTLDTVLDERDLFPSNGDPQEALFNEVGGPMVAHAIGGYNTCILAYGQSGSGKTHTIIGTPHEEGILPRMLRALVANNINRVGGSNTRATSLDVSVSILELYNEVPSCLYTKYEADGGTANRGSVGVAGLCSVRESPTEGPYVEGLRRVVVTPTTLEDSIAQIHRILSNSRRVGGTNQNVRSSRSHVLCTIHRAQHEILEQGAEGNPLGTSPICVTTSSKTCIVDLAGSERVGQHASVTGIDTSNHTNTPRGFGEGVAINQSLLTLGLVINAVADAHSAPHTTAVPPFRNSKLTYILKDALRGEALTAVVATLQPNGSFTDLTDTLRFASRCASIKVMVRRCRRLDVSSQRASELAAENLILKQQLARMTEAFAQQQITTAESSDAATAASSPLPNRSVSVTAKDAWLGLNSDHTNTPPAPSLDVAAPPSANPSTSRAPYYSRDGIQYRLPYLGVSNEHFLLPVSPLPLTSERCGDRTLAYSLEDRVGAVRVLSARFVAPEEFLGMVPSSSEDGVKTYGDPNSISIPFPQLINTPTVSAAICWVKTEVGRNTGGEMYHTLEVPPSGALLFKVSVDGRDCDDSNLVYPLRVGSTITLVHSASLYTVVFRYVSPAHPTRTASQSLPPAPGPLVGLFGDRGDAAVAVPSAAQEGWNNLEASPVRRYLLDACIAQPSQPNAASSPTRRLHTDTTHTSHRRPHKDLVSSDDDGTPEGSDTDRSFSVDTDADTVSEGSLNATPAPPSRPTPKPTGNSPPHQETVPVAVSHKDILGNVPLPPQVRRWGRSVRLVEEYIASALAEAYETVGGREVEEDAVGDALITKWRSATRPNECQALQSCIHDSCAELHPPFCTGPGGTRMSLLHSTLEAGGSAEIKALLSRVQGGGALDKTAARQCCESLLARHLYLVDGWWLWVARELNNDADTPDRKDDVTVRIFVRRNTSNLGVLPSNPTDHHMSLFLSECVSEDYTTYPLPPKGFDTPSMVFALYLLRRMLQVQNAIPIATTAPFDLRCRTVVTKLVETTSIGGRSHSQSGELSAPPSPARPDTAILPVRWHDWNYSSVADLHGANIEVVAAYHSQCTTGRGGVEHARLVAKSLQLAASLEDAEQEVSSAGMRIQEGQSALHTTSSQLYDETQQLRHQLAVRETMVAQGVQRAEELEVRLAKAASTQRALEASILEKDAAAQFAAKQKASLEQRLVVSQLELSRMLVLRQETAKDQDASERTSVVGRVDSSPIQSHAASSSSLPSRRVFQRTSPPALTQSNLSSLRPADRLRPTAVVSRSSSMSATGREPAHSPRTVRAVDVSLKAPAALRPQSASSARRTASSGSAHHQQTHRSGVAAGSIGPEVVLPQSHDSTQRNRVMLSGHHRDPHTVPLAVSEEQQRVHDECTPEPTHHQQGGEDARSRFVLVEEKEEVERQLQQYKMASASKDAEVRGLHEALDQMEARHGDKERHWVAMMDGYDTTIRTLTLELDRQRELAIAKERARIRGKRAAEKPNSTPVVSKVAQQIQSGQQQHPSVQSSSTIPIHHPLPPSVIEQRSAEVRRENKLLQREVAALRVRLGEMGVRMEGAARLAR